MPKLSTYPTTTPALADRVPLVDDPAGSATVKLATFSDIFTLFSSATETITSIDSFNSAVLTGDGTTLVTGTAGTANTLAKWDVDGNLVSGPVILDEDDLASNSDEAVATQRSIKTYVDNARLNAQTGTTYTLVADDNGKTVTMDNGSANTLTIPAEASVDFPVGAQILVIQKGAGTTTIAGDTGVTVNGVSAGSGDMSAQYQGAALVKVDADTWLASGSIGTVA